MSTGVLLSNGEADGQIKDHSLPHIVAESEKLLLSCSLTVDTELYQGVKVRKVNPDGSLSKAIFSISQNGFLIFVRSPSTAFGFVKDNYKKLLGNKSGKIIDITDILHVFHGFVGTRRLEKSASVMESADRETTDKKLISIIYSDFKTLNLVAETVEDADKIYSTIHFIKKTYHSVKDRCKKEDLLLRYLWYDADKDKDGTMSWTETQKVLQRLNIFSSEAVIKYKDIVKTLGRSDDKLTFTEFANFLQQFKNSAIENMIWDRAFGKTTECVSESVFLDKFLRNIQKETNATLQTVGRIFRTLQKAGTLPSSVSVDHNDMTIRREQFGEYLYGSMNQIIRSNDTKLHESEMNQPLSNYWINTSHNTYSTGDQLTSESSVEMYLYVLCRGCRSVEIDCWDGGFVEDKKTGCKRPVPMVYHGHTLTSRIKFIDVIRCIKGWVLENPDTYPVILSFENHCSPPFQIEMANILRDIFGSLLYIPCQNDLSGKPLPSPAHLRGRVIVKGKRPLRLEADSDNERIADDDDNDDDEDEDERDESERVSKEDDNRVPKIENHVKTVDVKIVPELAKLTLLRGVKFKAFTESLSLDPTNMHALSEFKIAKLMKKSNQEILKLKQFNVHHMTRAYPKGTRVDSSNLNPLLPWSLGTQMIALNFQVTDSPVFMNDGRFRVNGNCGYVRKPQYLTDGKNDYESTTKPVKIQLKVLSASCLPKPDGEKVGEIIDSYVIVTLYDIVNGGNKSTSHSTKMIRDNGFSPTWNEEKYTDFKVYSPDLAMLEFKVMDKDVARDDEVAFNAIPVSVVRDGIRCIELYDSHNTRRGPYDYATLLVEVTTTQVDKF